MATKENKIQEYKERKEKKINYYKSKAEQKKKQAQDRFDKANEITRFIPPGQPILVGHHSEKKHRRAIAKIDVNMTKANSALRTAEYYEKKAKTIEENKAISSDDPEAIKKMKKKIAGLEEIKELMKAANKIWKRNKTLEGWELPEKNKHLLKEASWNIKESWEKKPFPPFSIKNLGANINRCKKRLKELQSLEERTTSEREMNGIKVVENADINRVQIFFPGIPEQETRSYMKSNGFRWSRKEGAWQRHLNNQAIAIANKVMHGEF